LGVLPLWQGQWLVAAVAGVGGLSVVGSWAWGTSSGRTVGVAVGAGLVTFLAVVFAVSQWPRRGLINPPWFDWFAGWLLIGVGCVAALLIDWIAHASDGLVRIGPTARPRPVRQWVTAMTAVVAAPLVFGCCMIAMVLDENDGALRFTPRASEILPLPPTLRLISAGPCVSGGSAGGCRAEFVVAAADGATRAVTAARLVDHLRRLGWPMQTTQSAFAGCRDIGGILPWTPHCLVLHVDADPTPARPPIDPDAVMISVTNIG
jgi:hypothetical protein